MHDKENVTYIPREDLHLYIAEDGLYTCPECGDGAFLDSGMTVTLLNPMGHITYGILYCDTCNTWFFTDPEAGY